MKATFIYDGKKYNSFNKLRFIEGSFGFDIIFTVTNDAGEIVDLSTKDVLLQIKDIAGPTLKNIDLVYDSDGSDGKVRWEVAETDLNLYTVFDTEITVINNGVSEKKFNIGLLTVVKEL